MRATRSFLVHSAVVACGALALPGCSAKYAVVPPRVDLAPHGPVALAVFTTDRPDDSPAAAAATARFAESVLESQHVELLELGLAADTAFRTRADSAGAPAVFVGHLRFSRVTPRGSLGGGGLNVRGEVTAELSVRLVNVRTGGTLWRSSSAASGTVGRLAIGGGLPSVAVRDRDEAYGTLVTTLVGQVTRDLRATRVRQ